MSGITLHVMLHRKTHRTNTSSLQAALLLPDRGFELHSVGAGRVPKDLEGCKFIKVCRPPLSLPRMLITSHISRRPVVHDKVLRKNSPPC
jgi:hypothetical protein